jgi:PAS domain S-box-containing protein
MNLHPEAEPLKALAVNPAELDPVRRTFHENQDWYRDLIEHSQDLLCIHDLEGRLLSVNQAPARILGYSVEEILRIPMRELIAPEYREQFEAYLNRIESEGEARGLLALLARSGERRIWEYSNTLRREAGQKPIVSGMARDVTEQKRAERLLREANELNRQIIAGTGEGIAVYDCSLRCVLWNPFMERLTGVPAKTALGKTFFDLVPAEVRAHHTGLELMRALEGQTVTIPDERRTVAAGNECWVSSRKVPLRNAQGEIVGVIVTLQDITERKLAEAKLWASEHRYRALYESSPVGVCWVESRTGQFLGANPKFCEIAGRTEAELLQLSIAAITHPDDMAESLEKLRQLLDGEVRHYEMEKRYLRPDGSARWVEVEIVAMWQEGETPDWHMAIVQDITERKHTLERLREHERAVEGLEEMIVVLDRESRFVLANRAYLDYRGKRKDEVVGHLLREVIGPGLFEMAYKEKIDECFAGKAVQFEVQREYSVAGDRHLLGSCFPIVDAKGTVDRIVVIVQDLTVRTQTEEALRQSEQRFRVALAGSPIKVFNQDRNLRYTWVYNVQEGWSEKDYLGKTDEEIFGPEVGAQMRAMKQPVLETGQGQRQEFTLTTHGNTYYCDVMVEPLLNSAGEVEGINCACVDVTRLREITEELRLAKEKLSEEKLYLEEAIDSELGFGEIVGRSAALKRVMGKVTKVSPSEATVLLLGETGTGKELVARELHHRSGRNGKSFIKLNCAAIPSGLLESELFGHEKGAFTGAVGRKLGRLEIADGGTLFLDEIGEIPLSLQPKLLRVLQDMEFERLGGTQTIKVNFRLLAATNRDLAQSVLAREFRSDLYYRLNVFPILIPPLRERREDIRPLVEHFVRKFSLQMKKSIISIPSTTMELLMRWDWPGNVRELENFVERSVILTPGPVLQAPLAELERDPSRDQGAGTLREKDREAILRVLRECHGKLGGADGAAARLGLKRTTLQSKLDQLGIKPAAYRT